MKCRIHRALSEQIRECCEGRLNVRINPFWFALGSIYPDCTHQRLIHMHEIDAAGNMVRRMIGRFCRRSIFSGQNLSRWRSLRLGIIMHYVSDFSCYVHTPAFDGTLLQHRAYEEQQGDLHIIPQRRDICSFYEAEDASEAFAMFARTLKQRDRGSFSPAGDLDYALSVSTELAYAMLRISMGENARLPFRYRIPIVGQRLYRAASAY